MTVARPSPSGDLQLHPPRGATAGLEFAPRPTFARCLDSAVRPGRGLLRCLVLAILSGVLHAAPPTTDWNWERLPPQPLGNGSEPGKTTPVRVKPPVADPTASRPRFDYATLVGGSGELRGLLSRVRDQFAEFNRADKLWRGDDLADPDDPLRLVVTGLRAAHDSQDLDTSAMVQEAARYLALGGGRGDVSSRREALFVLQTLWLRAALDLSCLGDAAAMAETGRDGLSGIKSELMNAFKRAIEANRKTGLALQDPVGCGRNSVDYARLWREMESANTIADSRPPDPRRPTGGVPGTRPRDPDIPPPTSAPIPTQGDRRPEPANPSNDRVANAAPGQPPPDCNIDPVALDQRMDRVAGKVRDLVGRKEALHEFYWSWYHRVPAECVAFTAAYREHAPLLTGLDTGELETELNSTYACLKFGHARLLAMAANPFIGQQLSRMVHQQKRVDEHLAMVYAVASKKRRLIEGIEAGLSAACRDPDH